MGTKITIEEAKKLIGKYPDEDLFIMEYLKRTYNEEWGTDDDNSIELSDYYKECQRLAIPLHREQGEEVAQPWQQVISDRINYFATHHHKFESKELHDALNVILRLVPPALWQAASQEKGVGEDQDVLWELLLDTIVDYIQAKQGGGLKVNMVGANKLKSKFTLTKNS